jgi:hypothetical protein
VLFGFVYFRNFGGNLLFTVPYMAIELFHNGVCLGAKNIWNTILPLLLFNAMNSLAPLAMPQFFPPLGGARAAERPARYGDETKADEAASKSQRGGDSMRSMGYICMAGLAFLLISLSLMGCGRVSSGADEPRLQNDVKVGSVKAIAGGIEFTPLQNWIYGYSAATHIAADGYRLQPEELSDDLPIVPLTNDFHIVAEGKDRGDGCATAYMTKKTIEYTSSRTSSRLRRFQGYMP